MSCSHRPPPPQGIPGLSVYPRNSQPPLPPVLKANAIPYYQRSPPHLSGPVMPGPLPHGLVCSLFAHSAARALESRWSEVIFSWSFRGCSAGLLFRAAGECLGVGPEESACSSVISDAVGFVIATLHVLWMTSAQGSQRERVVVKSLPSKVTRTISRKIPEIAVRRVISSVWSKGSVGGNCANRPIFVFEVLGGVKLTDNRWTL